MVSSVGRQRSAVQSILLGLVIGILPWSLPVLANKVKAVAVIIQSLRPVLEHVLPWLSWGCWAIATVLTATGLRQFWRASTRATDIGTSIMPVLQPLQQQGWQFQSNVGTGENQTVACSPQGKTFCIVVKSERGRIGSDGRTVFRLVDQSKNPFSVDFVNQTKQRSARVQQRLKLAKVVPVLAFSEAILAIESNPIAGVYVVEARNLRRTLLELA